MTFRISAFLLHTVAAAIMAYGYLNLTFLPFGKYVNTQKGGRSQYLTMIGLGLAFLAMIFGAAADLLPTVKIFTRVKRALLMIALPIATIVTTIYWGLVFFWIEMIMMPLPLDMMPHPDETVPTSGGPVPLQRIPLRIDLSLHAVPAIVLLIDFFAFEKKYSRAQAVYGGTVLSAIACVAYGSWVEYLAPINGSFPYPFLTESPFNIRVAIYVGATTFALLTFWILNALHA